MPDELSIDDVEAETADRGEDGELITNTREIEWGGQTKELEIKPITGGVANRIAKHEAGLAELDPQAVAVAISVACPNLEDISSEHIEDMPVEKINALISPITDELPEVEAGNS